MAEENANQNKENSEKKAPKENGKKDDKAQQPPSEAEEAVDYRDKMLRLAAEFDNYKKRIAGELQNSKSLGKAELIRKMLPVLDEFELAMGALDDSEAGKPVMKGFGMVYSNLKTSLEKEGLREIHAKGTFDPYRHEIVTVLEDSKKPSGTILEVVKKGYTFENIMLRPAAVIIAREKKQEEASGEKKA